MKKYLAILWMSFLLFSCGRFENKDEKKDHSVRMVCIAKQYNEIIYALGAEQDLAAVDISSTYPPEIKKLPTVGYHRALSVEGILAAKPTLILHDNNIGPEHVIKQLNDLKIPMMVFKTNGNTIDSTKILIREMGEYFHKKERADEICNKLDSDMVVALAERHQYKDSLKVLVIHFGQASNVYLVMTQNSIAAKMVEWSGCKMAIDDQQRGMKQLSAEVVAASDPDVILLTDFGYDRLGTNEKIKELPGIGGTRAAKNNRIYRVEEHDMVYIGPRTGEIALALQKLIHQGANK